MKHLKKAFICLCVTGMAAVSLIGCGKKKNDSTPSTISNSNTTTAVDDSKEKEDVIELSGSIKMSGSTSMEKLVNAVIEDFMNKNKKVTITTEFVGSSAGVEAVLNETVDIGNASRNLKDSEKESGAVENIAAIDGIAVIVDNANTVKNLSKDELIKIYTGTIKNWSELGGQNAPIVVVGREAGSGTRGAFEEILDIADTCQYANELDNTGAVVAKVASTPGAIGYVSLDVLNDTVTAVSLDDVEATVENIKSGSYFFSRPFVMATKGEISEQSVLIQSFFNYMKSEEGKAIIEQVGLIVVD